MPARPSVALTPSAAPLSSPLPRPVPLSLGIAVAAAGAMANAVAAALSRAADTTGTPDVGVSKIVLLCAALGLIRVLGDLRAPLTLPALLALLPALAGGLGRGPDIAWTGLAVTAALLLLLPQVRGALRDGVWILLLVALHGPAVGLAGALLGGPLLTADAALAALVLSLIGAGGAATGNAITAVDGHTLLLVWKCGVLSNLSLALLIWHSGTRFLLGRLPRSALPYAVLVVAIMVLVNALRLAAMAMDPALFDLLHGGSGEQALRLGTMALVAAITALGVRRHAAR